MYEIQLTCGADKGQCRMKVSPAAVIFFLCVLTVTGCATTSNSPVTEDQDDSLQQLKHLQLMCRVKDLCQDHTTVWYPLYSSNCHKELQ